MEVFSNFKLTHSPSCVILEADYHLEELSVEDGSFVLGTPLCWDDELFDRIMCEEYVNFHLFSYTLGQACVNRITNHKGIWGLTRLSQGEYCTYSDTAEARTYIGVDISVGKTDYYEKGSAVTLLVPKGTSITPKEVAALLCKPLDNFFISPSVSFMLEIQKAVPNSIMLFHHFDQKAQLIIVGNNAESLFSNDDCAKWECGNTSLCQHWK